MRTDPSQRCLGTPSAPKAAGVKFCLPSERLSRLVSSRPVVAVGCGASNVQRHIRYSSDFHFLVLSSEFESKTFFLN